MSEAKNKKLGLKKYQSGEMIFQENEIAESLFIIQSGQIRLFRPKGRGFVDLAVLRTGEVVGEMSFFDEKSRRRSCSAAAIVPTEVIEISFVAFERTISHLGPWLNTIISTLVDRLRTANEKVKSLESNSTGYGKRGRVAGYVFFHSKDLIKILSTLYLVFKNFSSKNDSFWTVSATDIKFFMFDIYNISEVKYEEFVNMMEEEYFLLVETNENGHQQKIKVKDPEEFWRMVHFL